MLKIHKEYLLINKLNLLKGLFVKPITGILDISSKTSEGLKNTF